MKDQSIKSLGFELTFSVPSDVAEFDKLAGRAGACLEEAIANVQYRGTLAVFRDAFCEALEKSTGIARLVKESGKKKDGTPIEVWGETEGDYVARVAAEQKVEVSAFAELAAATASVVKFDPSQTERKSAGPKKVAKMYADIVAGIKTKFGPEGLERAAVKLGGVLGREIVLDFTDETTTKASEDKLALAIKEKMDKEKDAQANALGQ